MCQLGYYTWRDTNSSLTYCIKNMSFVYPPSPICASQINLTVALNQT